MKRLVLSTLAVAAMLCTSSMAFAQHHGTGGHPHPLPPVHRPDPGHGPGGPGRGPDRWHGPEHGWHGGWDRNHYRGGWFWFGPSVILLWDGGAYVETPVIWDPVSGMYYWRDAFGRIHWVN